MRWFDLAEQDAKLEMVEDGPGATKLVLDMAADCDAFSVERLQDIALAG